MRLLDAETLQLHEYQGQDVPPYAILSHTWGADEVTFQDMQHQWSYRRKKGFSKLKGACKRAQMDGYKHIWIDTCCIDKSSSAELSEAINSMFSWYSESRVCYAYLSDVEHPADASLIWQQMKSSRWWTRGWTLQELIAPLQLEFFSKSWGRLGTKIDLAEDIFSLTKIPVQVLKASSHIYLHVHTSIAQRMSWAADRQTTRVEDIAYCLIGIFQIHMPLLYGEKEMAFIRLQQEIVKSSADQSLFAHESVPHLKSSSSMFAVSPAAFKQSDNIRPSFEVSSSMTSTSIGLEMQIALCPLKSVGIDLLESLRKGYEGLWLALLNCHIGDDGLTHPAIVLQQLDLDRKFYCRARWRNIVHIKPDLSGNEDAVMNAASPFIYFENGQKLEYQLEHIDFRRIFVGARQTNTPQTRWSTTAIRFRQIMQPEQSSLELHKTLHGTHRTQRSIPHSGLSFHISDAVVFVISDNKDLANVVYLVVWVESLNMVDVGESFGQKGPRYTQPKTSLRKGPFRKHLTDADLFDDLLQTCSKQGPYGPIAWKEGLLVNAQIKTRTFIGREAHEVTLTVTSCTPDESKDADHILHIYRPHTGFNKRLRASQNM